MGLFGSILNAIPATLEILRQTGVLKGTLAAVSEVAALCDDNDGVESQEITALASPVQQLYSKYITAEKTLTDLVNKKLGTIANDASSISKKGNYAPLWVCPSSHVTHGGTVIISPDIYRDVASFLTLEGIPPVVGDVDVASHVAQALFANAPALLANGPTQVANTLKVGKFQLNSAIAFYPIPLQRGTAEQMWHSAIGFNASIPKQLLQTQLAHEVITIDDKPLAATPTKVTLEVEWYNAAVANNKLGKFKEHWEKNYSPSPLLLNTLVGSSQHLKVGTSTKISPATLRNQVISTCAAIIEDSKKTKVYPEVAVTNVVTTL